MEKLTEKIIAKPEEIKKLPENKITEATKENPEIVDGFLVPVWRLDIPNLNGRTYTTALGEKVVSQAPVTYALDGHDAPEVYEFVKAIGKNPQIIDGIMYAECYFVDRIFAEKVHALLKHGADLGLSSVGWGELNKDNEIVAETYQLERYFDFVFCPSYAVYLNGDSQEIKTDETKEDNSATVEMSDPATAVVSEGEIQAIMEAHKIKELRRK